MPQGRVVDQLLHCLADGIDGSGIYQQGCWPGYIFHGRDVAGDDRLLCGKTFDDRQSKSFIGRGEEDDIGLLVFPDQFILGYAEDVGVFDPKFFQQLFLVMLQLTDDPEVNRQLKERCDGNF